jgi:peroxin-19
LPPYNIGNFPELADHSSHKCPYNAEWALEEMIRQMMGGQPAPAPAPPAAKKNEPSKSKEIKKSSTSNNKNNNNNNSKGSKSPSKPKKEKNVDETIASLLNNIHKPPTNEPDLSTLTDQTISTLLTDINAMTSSPDANPLIDTVMKQLLEKELMYTPMKEVCTRFPSYLAQNKPPTDR